MIPPLHPSAVRRCVAARRLALPATAAVLVAVAGCASSTPSALPAPAASVPPAAPSPAQPATTPTAHPAKTAQATSSTAAKTGTPAASNQAPKVPAQQPAPRAKVDCGAVKCIALTFDDGPGKDTPKLLDALTSKGAVATFFMQGVSIQANADTVRRIGATPGMELAEHSWNHPQLTGLGREGAKSQMSRTHAKIKELTGTDVTLMRPPYGARNATVDAVAKEGGEAVILWDVDTLDWKTRNSAAVRESVKKQARPGSIVLMHDIHPTTVNAVPAILDDLKAEGYVFVTVTQLLGGTDPGKVYTRRD